MSRAATASLVLAADVGGTNTRLGLFRAGSPDPAAHRVASVPSDPDTTFLEVMAAFLRDAAAAPGAACLAVAGPVFGRRAAMTNHPWVFDADQLSTALGGIPVRLANDLEATAVSMPYVPASRLAAINEPPGFTRRGNVAVVAPGTGLGCASLVWDGERHHPVASEGGHTDFAPRDDVQVALWRFLHARHGHVSWERIVSGSGIATLYEFLRDDQGVAEAPEVRSRLDAAADHAPVISQAACAGHDPLARATLDLFARVLGARAGNAALEVMALGGVFLGGGIPPRVLPALTSGTLLTAFLDKGRQRALLERIPLHVALEPDAALLGAARLALAQHA
jgi:glucokinase